MDAFLSLLEPSLKNLLEPAEKALDDVYNILIKAANRSLKKTTLRFPLIFEELFDVIKNYFDQVNFRIIKQKIYGVFRKKNYAKKF